MMVLHYKLAENSCKLKRGSKNHYRKRYNLFDMNKSQSSTINIIFLIR